MFSKFRRLKIKHYLILVVVLLLLIQLGRAAYFVFKQYYPPDGKEIITIDLSEGAANKEGFIFQIPRAYLMDGYLDSPLSVGNPAKVSLFWMGFYPNGDPYYTLKGPKHTDKHIDVLLVNKGNRHMDSEYLIKGQKVHWVRQELGMDIYELDYGNKKPTIARFYVYQDWQHRQVVIEDPGTWSYKYNIYRPLTKKIELNALIDKKIYPPQTFKAMDRKILAFVQTFQVVGS